MSEFRSRLERCCEFYATDLNVVLAAWKAGYSECSAR